MIKVVVINGVPRSGKDMFVNFCLGELGILGNAISTVDYVKDVARALGWNGEKTPENRRFLSDLKDALTRWDDIPYKKVMDIKEAMELEFTLSEIKEDGYLFVHCREPKEIQKFVDRNNAITVLLRRRAVESVVQSNKSDNNVFNFSYDFEIDNEGSLEELRTTAKLFLKTIKS